MTTETTEPATEPAFTPGRYRVTFERIGRNRPAPLEVDAVSGPDLADMVAKYARGYLGSRYFDVDVCWDGTGYVTAGFRPAGDFRWEILPTPEEESANAGD